jgi:hypothetical protein
LAGRRFNHPYIRRRNPVRPVALQIPESIPRETYLDMIRGLGIDPAEVISMTWAREGLHAAVFALNAEGRRYVVTDSAGVKYPATHTVWIRVDDISDVDGAPSANGDVK